MERIHGATLEQEVERFGPVETARACRIALDVLSGLAAIHNRGLVHRDIKPSNVMLDLDDRAVLLDLGVALHRRKRPLTPLGMATGTPEFMAPEQLEAARLDGRTDLYQLGRILVYLVTGCDDEHDVELTLAKMTPALREIARRATAPIGERYQSADQMRAALVALECEASAVVPTPVEAGPVCPPVRAPNRRLRIAWRVVVMASLSWLAVAAF
jgi:serine/threonine protein kinase